MREAARISGREFAKRAGWADGTIVSRIEKAQRTITADHVRLWCQICGASQGRAEELLAEQAAVAGMWISYQQLNRGGLKKAQESVRDKYERLRLLRVYQSRGIPGLLQSEGYLREVLADIWSEQGVEADDRVQDIAGAVAERMDRQSVLHRPGKRFVFVVEEVVLRYRTVSQETHAEQLRHLLAVMCLPSVSFGVIPMNADRRGMRPRETFTMTDNALVNVELVSGYLSVRLATEVAMYTHAFERLFALAVHGDRAEALIEAALQELG